jgi:probable rRNA maturation factor
MSGSRDRLGNADEDSVPERVREIIVRAASSRGVDTRSLAAFAHDVLDACGVGRVSLGIKLTTDGVMRRMNRRFRGVDRTTDVLSFEGDDAAGDERHLGDIVISLDTASRQASQSGLDLERELRELVLHGCLHLLGHDHERDDGEMDRLELTLRHRLLQGAGTGMGVGE